MFVKNVVLKLKKDGLNDFKRLAENEVLPILRRQNGFRDEILCVAPQRLEAQTLTFWDNKEASEAFEKTALPNIMKRLSNIVEGSPRVDTVELVYSTLHKSAAKA